jgi:ABC-2 type transport system ATP-binding protein
VDAIVTMAGVVKRFGHVTALDGLDLVVEPGQVHGFLGPNGAGKTTALRILLGLLRADAGTTRVLGQDPWRDPTLLRLAYVPGEVSLWPSLTGGEAIDLLGRLSGTQDAARRDALIQRFALDPTRRARTYSTGNRQKVALIAALACDVDLYVLDEPTGGLDPLMQEEFRDCVRELREQGRTVLLSSHLLDEVEALADHVTIVRAGRAVESAPLAQLRHLTDLTVTAVVRRDLASLTDLAGVTSATVTGVGDGRWSVTARVSSAGLTALLAVLADAGTDDLTSTPPSLEDLFLQHYAR